MSKQRKPKAEETTEKAKPAILFVRMPDYLEAALQSFIAAQIVAPDRTAVAVTALEEFLRKHGHLPPATPRKP